MAYEGRVVLLTGAGSGLGQLLAVELARQKATLLLWDLREELLHATGDLVGAQVGSEAQEALCYYMCDLSSRDEIYATANRLLMDHPHVHVLINNAGIVSGKKFLDTPEEMVEKTMAVNCMAHMWMAKKFLPRMIAANDGHIVNIVSAAATVGVVGLADYCASKWAAFGFDESLRLELAKEGIEGVRTTCVCPYYIATGMFEGATGSALLPVLQPAYVVSRIMAALASKPAVVHMPRLVGYTALLRGLLPTCLFDAVCRWLGVCDSMDSFKGRGDAWAMGEKKNA